MKRKIALILSLMICSSLFTACGEDEESSSSGKSASAVTSASAETTEVTTSEASSEEDITAEASSEEDTTASATTEDVIVLPTGGDTTEPETAEEPKAAKDTNFKRGVIENGVYHSDYADITFRTPDGWSELSEEQVLSLMNLGLELTGNEELLDEELMKQQAIYDYAARAENGANAAVMFQNLKIGAGEFSDMITEEVYLETIKEELKNVSGISFSEVSPVEKVTLNDHIYYRYSQTSTYKTSIEYTVNQTYYVRRLDDFMIMIIFTSGPDNEDMRSYEKYFE